MFHDLSFLRELILKSKYSGQYEINAVTSSTPEMPSMIQPAAPVTDPLVNNAAPVNESKMRISLSMLPTFLIRSCLLINAKLKQQCSASR
jgi:hypothetical protein